MPNIHTPPNVRVANQPFASQPNFLQQRGQNNFPFGGGIQQQQTQPPSQHNPQPPLTHTPLQPQQPPSQQPGTANTSLPPHLTTLSNLNAAPSASSTSEVGLDPNDFPALGSNPANTLNTPSTTNATSYATQAGTGVVGAGNGAQSGSGANQQREFTVDDFPALGVAPSQPQPPASQQQQQPPQNTTDGSHPPGLNGFQQQQHADQQHRQNLLGSLTGGQQQPGLLNLGQARNQHPAFQSEAEKRNQALKVAAAAWSSPSSQQPTSASFPTSGAATNGASHSNHVQPSQQSQQQSQAPQPPGFPGAPAQTTQQQQHLVGPPGVPPPSSFPQSQPQPPSQQQQSQPPVQAAVHSTPYVSNGANVIAAGGGGGGGDTLHPLSQGPAQATTTAVAQTPAQQVLMSPADKWGLLGLLAMIKSADLDTNLLSVGTDLGTMGLDMQNPGSLYSTFITPWADSSAAHQVEPDFHLPGCYNVQPPPPGPSKVSAFSDETLFFMFYACPRDALQEVAAQELYTRSWRYHKDMHLWITKESGTSPSQKVAGGEQGTYSYWDPENWERARKDMIVLYADLEEKAQPLLPQSQNLQLPPPPPGSAAVGGATTPAGVHAAHAAQAGLVGQQQGAQGQGPLRVGAFQGMGMAAM
ncbi:hypothetical protein NLI96_g7480 [Meripilus lineatus]|uniref:NOT2/NOT3/NOT5 C-terminal domain-containing protein n=1 Tax=Meripilus lineatus TaxID=2056292 RepID=A0AAD5YH69_9APHY|nr:hypothetical protein NLI96_g7480 [Physisporinus lineatus]